MEEGIPSPNPVRFIEDALFCTGPLALSYSDPDQKWIIRQHLISLFQDFPSLKPSVAFFTHNDGTEVKLLNANGRLQIPGKSPPVSVTIWVHEFYPQIAPIVFVDSKNSMYPIHENHPFVDSSSGLTISSYLENWQFPRFNLSELVHNLIKLFSLNHQFYYSGLPRKTHPSMVSKMEAMDRLTCMIYYGTWAIMSETEDERKKLLGLKAELEKRARASEIVLRGLQHERNCLKERVEKLSEESDMVLNWLKVYEKSSIFCLEEDGIENAFGGLDKKSEALIDLKAGDEALEDLMYGLEKAVEKEVLSPEVYIKQVRVLAREQFWHRAKVVKLERQRNFPSL